MTPTMQTALRLFALSLVSLFAELLIIRWLSADIRAFSIFKTFPLVTFYVGLGLGLASTDRKYSRWFVPAVLYFAIVMKLASVLNFGSMFFPTMIQYNWQEASAQSFLMYVLAFMLLLPFVLLGPLLMSLAIGSEMAAEFNKLKPLPAYSVNLVGALSGSVLFALLSFAGLPPWLLLIIPAVVMLVLSEGTTTKKLINAVVVAVACGVAAHGANSVWSTAFISNGNQNESTVYWSPYQRLDMVLTNVKVGDKLLKEYLLLSNHLPYQIALDLNPKQCDELPLDRDTIMLQTRWMLPYEIRPASDDVLIIASGMGSDVAQAIWYDSKHIDAVDIDPVIMNLGKQLHPLKPYADPRVNAVCDDARHFFSTTKKKYDLLVFSHLDSHTVVGVSSVRLDNYIYTAESFKQALGLLKPDGIMVVSFWTKKDWFKNRLYDTICNAAGYKPVVLISKLTETDSPFPNTAFILGKPVKDGTFKLPDEVLKKFELQELPSGTERTLTDDWPFLYLGNSGLDWGYVVVLLEVLAITVFSSRRLLFTPAAPVHWQLFFMGGAFMLLELQFIARLALLFGSTWITTSIVINGVLLLILLSNLLVSKFRSFFADKLTPLYVLLFASIVGSYALPYHEILLTWQTSQIITYGVVCLVTFLPVFVVAIIFAVSFDRVTDNSRALAFNILGAVVGALFEYLTIYTGTNSLLWVVAAFYAVSMPFALRSQKALAGSPAQSDAGLVD